MRDNKISRFEVKGPSLTLTEKSYQPPWPSVADTGLVTSSGDVLLGWHRSSKPITTPNLCRVEKIDTVDGGTRCARVEGDVVGATNEGIWFYQPDFLLTHARLGAGASSQSVVLFSGYRVEPTLPRGEGSASPQLLGEDGGFLVSAAQGPIAFEDFALTGAAGDLFAREEEVIFRPYLTPSDILIISR